VLGIEAAKQFLADRFGLELSSDQWIRVLQPWLIPRFQREAHAVVLTDDLLGAMPVLQYCAKEETSQSKVFSSWWDDSISAQGVKIDIGADRDQLPSGFFAACNNLLRKRSSYSKPVSLDLEQTHGYIGLSRVATTDSVFLAELQRQRSTFDKVTASAASQFANSAYYMGSKRVLAPFLVEAVFAVADGNTRIVDLMCGSGAASGAFARFWPTYASDAQTFCRVLAQVQGGGFTRNRATHLLEQVVEEARKNIELLRHVLGDLLDEEDRIFHDEFGPKTVDRYKRFWNSVPRYPNTGACGEWNPSEEVAARKRNARVLPFCLCTAYFANVYFGLRQAVEIDSIRYAVGRIEQQVDRDWVLGALITTMSAVGLTYAGHFAQPLLRSAEDITEKNLSRILERRAISVMHEFSIRLLNLAEESERAEFTVVPIPGPWRDALRQVKENLNGKVIVYLDAPYKREEYSRYYHVLETVCEYKYPGSSGLARIPQKLAGERFRSEFFTRNRSRMTQAFLEVIGMILENKWTCAWSYSDNAAVNPVDVIEAVTNKFPCTLHSFATPYVHKPQGGTRPKRITEYLVQFIPR
jgi:adenine-specific DNA-methyltransferase